jgi:uncharacterized protein (TIGR02266 family)
MSEKKSVLVVCGTAAGQMYLGVLLNRMWYAPILAKSADEGVQISQYAPFSTIIVDGDVPENELRASLTLLTAAPALRGVPIIACITRDGALSEQQFFELGCSSVLSKPLDLSIVSEALSRLSGQPRNNARVAVKMRVDIREGVPEKTLICTNISEGGLHLRTARPLPEKTALHLSFTLPRSGRTISVTSEVVRTSELGTRIEGEPGMGLRFVKISKDDLTQIKNFVQWELASDLEWEPAF